MQLADQQMAHGKDGHEDNRPTQIQTRCICTRVSERQNRLDAMQNRRQIDAKFLKKRLIIVVITSRVVLQAVLGVILQRGVRVVRVVRVVPLICRLVGGTPHPNRPTRCTQSPHVATKRLLIVPTLPILLPLTISLVLSLLLLQLMRHARL